MSYTDEDLDDIIMGSGAETWDWYVSAIELIGEGEDELYSVTLWTPESDEGESTKRYEFSRGQARQAMRDLVAGKVEGAHKDNYMVGYIKDDNNDACSVDLIVQACCYGKVIFS